MTSTWFLVPQKPGDENMRKACAQSWQTHLHLFFSLFFKCGFVSLLRDNCDLLPILSSAVKVPVFRDGRSRGANAGEV